MKHEDELMEDVIMPDIHEAFFQFGEEDPIRFAFVAGGELSLTLKAQETDDTVVEFNDGKGKSFRIFLKLNND